MKLIFLLLFTSFSLAVNAQIKLDFDKDSTSGQPVLIAIPDSRGFVNDRAKTFTADETIKLIALMKSYKLDSTQVSILTVSSIDPFQSMEELANQYANTWKLGGVKKNGVLLVFSKELKKSRLQVGESLEAKFTPELLQSIDSIMIPEFVKGNYYLGTTKAIKKINQILNTQ